MSLDFLKVKLVSNNRRTVIEPEFIMNSSVKDIMIKGKSFYAIFDSDTNLWVTNRNEAIDIIDREIYRLVESDRNLKSSDATVLYLKYTSNGMCERFLKFCEKICGDNFVKLNQKVKFKGDKLSRKDYASFTLPYSLVKGANPSWDKLMNTLYGEEREKIEWILGAIINGDADKLQKFLVLEGSPQSGKSTVINVIGDMLKGYTATFSAKSLATASDQYALSPFSSFPLIAFDHDGDLSRIESNGRLNALISHEPLMVNEKFKGLYATEFNTVLIIATNESVQMSNAKTGLARRLIVSRPTNNLLPEDEYYDIMDKLKFEYPMIAEHCRNFYIHNRNKFKNYFDAESFINTNHVYDFFSEMFFDYSKIDGHILLNRLWEDYQRYIETTKYQYPLNRQKFSKEAKEYFTEYKPMARVDGNVYRNVFKGFKVSKFSEVIDSGEDDYFVYGDKKEKTFDPPEWLRLKFHDNRSDPRDNVLNKELFNCKAQIAVINSAGVEVPKNKWDEVVTKLCDILKRTIEVHYVMPPLNHIVIDFDLKDDDGNKSLPKNLEAASKFPKTYAEVSKSGKGLHLHYIYDGDVDGLSRVYDDGIEIKVFTGNSSLRRALIACNNEPIATISSGLPVKEDNKKVVNEATIKNEKQIRTLIKRNLCKEYHADTSSSVNFIFSILKDAYDSGVDYDVSDMKQDVTLFAAQSSNQSLRCLKLVSQMKFKCKKFEDEQAEGVLIEDGSSAGDNGGSTGGFVGETDSGVYIYEKPEFKTRDGFDLDVLKEREKNFIFFDTEVFPNLFVVVWKRRGDSKCVTWINPTGKMIEDLCKNDLIGFNNRNYDNHILYARMLGYSEYELYCLSQKIIGGTKGSKQNAKFSEAYKLAFTDIYDFAAAQNKMSLKKFEVKLGISHVELGLPWDEEVDQSLWQKVADYCINDVVSTESVFDAIYGDYTARVILADIAGGNIYDSTNSLSVKLMFNGNRTPQGEFQYRNLADPVSYLDDRTMDFFKVHAPNMVKERFDEKSVIPYYEGYKFVGGKSYYKGYEASEGGFAVSEPGIYWNIALIDIASMHPHSVIAECLFGPRYTETFHELVLARIYIKHGEYDKLSAVLGGRLSRYVELLKSGKVKGKDLSNALKTVINSVYGLTSAKFPNPFRDSRNIDNIVAKRGALTMIDLKGAVEEQGYTVVHIKTDSIKIADANPEIVKFVQDFGRRYGYEFEFEAVYERMAIVNKSCYICRFASPEFCDKTYGFIPKENSEEGGQWSATAAQFAEPYVFKTLFSHEPIEFKDFIQTKSVKTRMEIDCNEGLVEGEHNYRFVGKEGAFVPVIDGVGGGYLYRVEYDESVGEDGKILKVPKYSSVTGTKGTKWLEAEVAAGRGGMDIVDRRFFKDLVDEAVAEISQYGDFEEFVAV